MMSRAKAGRGRERAERADTQDGDALSGPPRHQTQKQRASGVDDERAGGQPAGRFHRRLASARASAPAAAAGAGQRRDDQQDDPLEPRPAEQHDQPNDCDDRRDQPDG